MREFSCNSCGLCCKNVPDMVLLLYNLPVSKDGGCANLLADNTCSIYKERPIVCDVKKGWEQKLKHHYTWDEWIDLNEGICKSLQDKEEADEL